MLQRDIPVLRNILSPLTIPPTPNSRILLVVAMLQIVVIVPQCLGLVMQIDLPPLTRMVRDRIITLVTRGILAGVMNAKTRHMSRAPFLLDHLHHIRIVTSR